MPRNVRGLPDDSRRPAAASWPCARVVNDHGSGDQYRGQGGGHAAAENCRCRQAVMEQRCDPTGALMHVVQISVH